MTSTSPHPLTVLFARGTIARLALWAPLQLAVHQSWGGPASAEKQRWLAGVIVDQFEPCIVASASATGSGAGSSTKTASGATSKSPPLPPDQDYVEELLLQIMADEFDLALEDDDSAALVARDVVQLFRAVCLADDTLVRGLEAQAEGVKGKLPKYAVDAGSGTESGSGSGSDWEDESEQGGDAEEVPQLLNHSEPPTTEVDEDGFTIVQKKGHR